MRVWTLAGGSAAALGALALVVASSAGMSGQQRSFTVTAGPGDDQKIIVRERGPVQLFRGLADDSGPKIGVSIRDVTADDVTRLKLPAAAGAVVDEVAKDGPASKAGVQKGDTFVSFDGETVRSVAQFRRLVRESVAGRAVKAGVLRDGKRVDLTVTPAEDDERDVQVWMNEPRLRTPHEEVFEFRTPHGEGRTFQMPSLPKFQWDAEGGPGVFMLRHERGRLGVMVQDLSPALAEYFGVKEGALVGTVNKETPAEKAGIKAGDVITAIDGKPVASAGDVAEQVRDKSGDVSVTVVRDKKTLTLKATLEKASSPKPKTVTPGLPG